MSMPLDPPGTPTIRRYVGRKFTSSNSTAALRTPGRGRSVRFQAVMVRGRKRQAAALAEFVEQRDGERGAFFGSRARAQFIDEHERARRGGFEHGAHVEHVRGKRGEIGGDRLFVADVHEHAIDERQARRLRGDGNAGLRGEHREAHRFERDGLAAGVRAADDEHGLRFRRARASSGQRCGHERAAYRRARDAARLLARARAVPRSPIGRG